MNSYSKGQEVPCAGTLVRVSDGAPTDPTTALFAYRDGAGTWHKGLTPTRDSTGVYHYDVDTSTPVTGLPVETWYYVFYSPSGDPEQAATQERFQIDNPGIF